MSIEFLVNLLNPKLTIFFFAFLPQFVSATESSPLLRMVALSAVFMVMTFVVFVGYGRSRRPFALTSSRALAF
jgi:threonine/homoserine/homoserine lactone efflux protein